LYSNGKFFLIFLLNINKKVKSFFFETEIIIIFEMANILKPLIQGIRHAKGGIVAANTKRTKQLKNNLLNQEAT
jgi:hypothetical protein